MNVTADLHDVTSVTVIRRYIPDSVAGPFWSIRIIASRADGNTLTLLAYTDKSLVIDDPDAPAVPWADADVNDRTTEPLPESVRKLEAELMKGSIPGLPARLTLVETFPEGTTTGTPAPIPSDAEGTCRHCDNPIRRQYDGWIHCGIPAFYSCELVTHDESLAEYHASPVTDTDGSVLVPDAFGRGNYRPDDMLIDGDLDREYPIIPQPERNA